MADTHDDEISVNSNASYLTASAWFMEDLVVASALEDEPTVDESHLRETPLRHLGLRLDSECVPTSAEFTQLVTENLPNVSRVEFTSDWAIRSLDKDNTLPTEEEMAKQVAHLNNFESAVRFQFPKISADSATMKLHTPWLLAHEFCTKTWN